VSAIFVSYSHHDRNRVIDIIEGLKRSRMAVWWDDELPPGQTWDDQVEAALERASTVIVVWSRDALASENVKDEAHYAREENKAMPVRIEDVKPPFRHRRLQFVDLFESPAEVNEGWGDLIAAITQRLGRGPDLTAASASANGEEAARPRGGVAISWRMLVPAALVVLSLVTHVAGTVAFGGQSLAVTAGSWGLGGAGLALAISNLMTARGTT
jgi:hypothetical protein